MNSLPSAIAAKAQCRVRHEGLLVGSLALLFFAFGAARTPLFDLDEGAFSQATLEMLRGGDWLRTWLNGEPRYDKPMLTYWLQALCVQAFGVSELAFRLPSILAATAWVVAVYDFTLRQTAQRNAAQLAAGSCGLSLMVGVIGRAATADALLNLLLCLAFFDIYRYSMHGRPAALRRVFLWLGLGFLTKGPVAIALPLIASLVFFAGDGRFRLWLRAAFDPLGWIILLAVTGIWLLPLFLQGHGDFLWQFLLQHNVKRYAQPAEDHGGPVWYYLIWLPLVLLPFSGLLPQALAGARAWRSDPLARYLLIWFALVFVVFSLAATKLPHYILYGCTPLFVLFGRAYERVPRAALVPALVFCGVLALLPAWLPLAMPPERRAFERGIVELALQGLDRRYILLASLLFVALSTLCLQRIPRWQRLLGSAALQAALVWGLVVPVLAAAQQQPVKEAALRARRLGVEAVSYRTALPSFSVYRGAATPDRLPQPGEAVFLRRDRIAALFGQIPAEEFELLYERGGICLLLRRPRTGEP